MVLAKECLKPCVKGVLKFQFFNLNLSSKFPASVRVKMSKYPYMDMCENSINCIFFQSYQYYYFKLPRLLLNTKNGLKCAKTE